ncbi:MAG: hypothetical protein PHC75_02335 [Burkholderiales bacterium]|nr:hypothetical protein [Burkholderiales bacterium]
MKLHSLNSRLLPDDKFLSIFIDSFDIHYSTQMVGLKDLNNSFLIVSEPYAQHMGMHRSELTKVCQRAKASNISLDLDARDIVIHQKYEHVIKNKQSVKYIDIHNRDGNTHAFVFTKSPLINPSTDNVVGVIHKLDKFSVPYIQHIFTQTNTNNSMDLNTTEFSDRERIILFFMSLGITNYKQIADIMTALRDGEEITHDNIKYSVKKLLKITDTCFYNDMLNSLASSGYIFDVPESFLTKGKFFIGQLDIHE